ncbi:MAG TPA: glycosyltransferase family 39 protein [Terriglobales bacterium]|nr:glycosyltransferase family 39 protein [Terriglobales bacterium]
MASALRSPLMFQPGPDEDFYLRFGQAVAQGASETAEFAFMDPAYGYILGFIFKLLGKNIYIVYTVQVVLDTVTALCIFLIGRELKRSRAGLLGALLYGLTCTAVYFSTTLLKATWVANFMTLWVLFSLILLRTQKLSLWLLFGLWCGYGIALRGNLVLMAGLSIVLLSWLNYAWGGRRTREIWLRAGVLCIGVTLPLTLLSLRNEHVSGVFSPLPNNGGIVLHHLYNPENPSAGQSFAKFVKYGTPSQIWRDYSKEAEGRVGHALTPHEVDRYWRGEAVVYIASHPLDVLRNVIRKLGEFVAYIEVPNNRSLEQDRLFSPVLRLLPSPFGWLFALGVPGIAVLLYRDRRSVLIIAPIAVAAATVAVFYSEDRFRFHAVPMLALGSGVFLEQLYAWIRSRQATKCVTAVLASLLLGSTSMLLASQMPQPQITWDRVIWGYLKMNSREAMATAKELALRIAAEQPANPKIQEALAYIAAAEGRYADAVAYYRRTMELRANDHVAHYNLAKMLVKVGDRQEAIREAALASNIEPLPEYQELLEELTKGSRAVKQTLTEPR